MNRKDIINKLVKEGMSEKTLVSFSDKQIVALASRMLSEQQQTTVTKTTYSKDDPKQMAALNAKLKSVAKNPATANTLKNVEIAESEEMDERITFDIPVDYVPELLGYTESDLGDEELQKINDFVERVAQQFGNANFIQDSDEEELCYRNDIDGKMANCIQLYIIPSKTDNINEAKKRLSLKQKKVMDTDKDGDIDAIDMKNLRKKKQSVEEKKKPSAGLTTKKKSEVVKAAKAGKDIGKKGKGFEKIASKAAEKYGSAEKGKKVAAAAMWKNVKREGHVVGNWLNALVEMEYHPLTSKKEILDLIRLKLNEQPSIAEPDIQEPEITPQKEFDYEPGSEDEPSFDPSETPEQNPDDTEMPEFMKLDNLIRYYNQNK